VARALHRYIDDPQLFENALRRPLSYGEPSDREPCEGWQASPSNPTKSTRRPAKGDLNAVVVFRCTASEKQVACGNGHSIWAPAASREINLQRLSKRIRTHRRPENPKGVFLRRTQPDTGLVQLLCFLARSVLKRYGYCHEIGRRSIPVLVANDLDYLEMIKKTDNTKFH
jgi:hypothetical protein